MTAAAEEGHTPWGELVAAALLGAERRTPPGGSVPALLDAAAVETVRRRAGARPSVAVSRPEPAPEDARPVLPPAAVERLATLLPHRTAGPGGGRRGAAPDLGELLPQWLAAAGAHGYRPPDERIPALLDAARARTDLRGPVLAFGGPRALWLARLNPAWRFALRQAADGSGAHPAEQDGDAVRRLWEEGLFAERVTLLSGLRMRDAAAGRALLVATWAVERAEDRLMFLDTLREGLSGGDEAFLEQALADRSRNVRATAAELLSGLPGSAFAARMAVRARSCVGPDRSGDAAAGARIAVEAPHECDAGMRRDGVEPKPPADRGERAWWLGQLVEAAPLATWTDRFAGCTPERLVMLPVADGWRQDLHAAWCRAAVRQRNPGWARALLGEPTARPAGEAADPVRLLEVLPAADRAAWAARFVAAHGLSEAFRILGVCAVPWHEPLGRAVLDALEIARDAGSYPWSLSGVMGLAERCLDPREADRLAPLAARPDESDDAAPGAGGYWSEAFQRLVSTLTLRREMLTELAGTPKSG